MFYFWVKSILTKSNISGMYFFQNENRKAEGCSKESQTSPGNYLFCWNSIISRNTISVENSQYSERGRIFWCSLSTKKWGTNSFPRELEGFVVCFALKGGYIFSPTGTERTSQTWIKMQSKRCQEESFCRPSLFNSLLQPALSTSSFNKSWIYTQTFRKQINK